jgi:hypothetical protein
MSEKKQKKEKVKLLINVKYNSERYSTGDVIEISTEDLEEFKKARAIETEETEDSEEA